MDETDHVDDFTHVETLKQEKSKRKTGFTKKRYQLLFMIGEEQASPGKIYGVLEELGSIQEDVQAIMSKLSEIHIKNKDKKNSQKISDEMEILENEYTEAINRANMKLTSDKDRTVSAISVPPQISTSGSQFESSYERHVSTGSGHSAPSIGQDMWKQLKRVSIPVFSGDKRQYELEGGFYSMCRSSASHSRI